MKGDETADAGRTRASARAKSTPGGSTSAEMPNLDVMEQIGIVRQGLEARVLVSLANEMAFTKERLITVLGFPRSTVVRKAAEHARLSTEQSERVLGMMKLVHRVRKIVEDSGDGTDFNAAHWVSQWLEESNPALGGKRPSEFMDTSIGQDLVSSLIARTQSAVIS